MYEKFLPSRTGCVSRASLVVKKLSPRKAMMGEKLASLFEARSTFKTDVARKLVYLSFY
jgi:hypothetical protein